MIMRMAKQMSKTTHQTGIRLPHKAPRQAAPIWKAISRKRTALTNSISSSST